MDQQPSSQASPTRQPDQDSSRPTIHRRHRWIWGVVLVLFGLLFYWAISQHSKTQAAATGGGRRAMMGGPVPVTLAAARTGNIGVYMDAITAQVTGVITAVHYREGQYVRTGDPLIAIDPRQYEAQLVQAQGLLE